MKLDEIPLSIASQKVSQKLAFDILDYPGYDRIKVSMDKYGLFTVSYRPSEEKDIDELSMKFLETAKNIVKEYILKYTQPVAYSHVKNGFLPLSFLRVILSESYAPNNLPKKEAGNYSIYYDDQSYCGENPIIYLFGPENESIMNPIDYFAYALLATRFSHEKVAMMIKLYSQTDKILENMEAIGEKDKYSDDNVNQLKKSLIDTDFTKRDCSQHYGRIQQASENFKYVNDRFQKENFIGDQNEVSKTLGIYDSFADILWDAKFLLPLWRDILIKNIEGLTSAVDARLSFQETLEVKKEQKEIRLLRHITLIGLVAGLIKLGGEQEFSYINIVLKGTLAIVAAMFLILVVELYVGEIKLPKILGRHSRRK